MTRNEPIPGLDIQARELSAVALDRLFARRDQYLADLEAGQSSGGYLAAALAPHGLIPADMLELTSLATEQLPELGIGPTLGAILEAARRLNPVFFALVDRGTAATPPPPADPGAMPSAS